MNKKIILGIVCALAVAGVAGIGVMKAGITNTTPIVNVGPFDGTVELDNNILLPAADLTESVTGSGDWDTLTITANTGDGSDFVDGLYSVSGTLTIPVSATATTTTNVFGIMTIDNTDSGTKPTIVLYLDKPLSADVTFALATAQSITFADGEATVAIDTTAPSTADIKGTLSLNDIEAATKAVEKSSLTDPTISVATKSYLSDPAGISVGVYRAENRTFYLRNSNDTGVAHAEIPYGNPGDVPLVFKGAAQDGIAVYRPSNTTVYLDSNNDGVAEKEVKLYLQEGDVVLGGTYTGSGATTTINSVVVYRPSTRAFYTDNGDGLLTETPVVFGNAGDTPFLVDGAKIGVYRASNQTIYVDSDLDGVANTSSTLAFAKAGDIPVYDGTNYGLYRPNTATFTFRVGGNDVSFVYGNPDDKPLVGDWQVKYWKTY